MLCMRPVAGVVTEFLILGRMLEEIGRGMKRRVGGGNSEGKYSAGFGGGEVGRAEGLSSEVTAESEEPARCLSCAFS